MAPSRTIRGASSAPPSEARLEGGFVAEQQVAVPRQVALCDKRKAIIARQQRRFGQADVDPSRRRSCHSRTHLTKAGNTTVRRVLIEGAWTYRFPARLTRLLQERQAGLPKIVRAIAWKAQVRLCGRYRRLMAAGKRQTVVTTAIAREMAAFLWAIGREIEPRLTA